MSTIGNTYVFFRHMSPILVSDRGHCSRIVFAKDFSTKKSERLDMTQHRRFSGLKAGVLAVPTVAILALTGCAGSAGSATGAGGAKEFSLSFATSNTIESPFQILAEKYMEANPDVKITFNPQPNDSYDQTLRTQLQAGNASDIVVTSPGSGQGRSILPLAEAGFLEPLDDSAKELLPEGSASTFGTDGKVFGQATAITVSALVTNEAAVKAAGDFPADFAALEQQCKTLESSGKSLFALAGAAPPNTGLTAMSLAASRVYAEDPAWNEKRAAKEVTFAGSEGWKSALEAVNTLKDAGCFQKGAAGAGFDAITKGLAGGTSLAGFIPATSWKQLESAAAGSEFAVRALPAVEGSGKDYVYASANYAFSINAAAKTRTPPRRSSPGPPSRSRPRRSRKSIAPAGQRTGPVRLRRRRLQERRRFDQERYYGPLPNIQWPNSAVYDALATGVRASSPARSLLTRSCRPWTQPGDSDTSTAPKPRRLKGTSNQHDCDDATQKRSSGSTPARRAHPGARRARPPRAGPGVRPLVVGAARDCRSSSPSTTSPPRSAGSSPSPTGRASATFSWVGFGQCRAIFKDPTKLGALSRTRSSLRSARWSWQRRRARARPRPEPGLKTRYVAARCSSSCRSCSARSRPPYVWKFIFDFDGPINGVLTCDGPEELGKTWVADPTWAIWTVWWSSSSLAVHRIRDGDLHGRARGRAGGDRGSGGDRRRQPLAAILAT